MGVKSISKKGRNNKDIPGESYQTIRYKQVNMNFTGLKTLPFLIKYKTVIFDHPKKFVPFAKELILVNPTLSKRQEFIILCYIKENSSSMTIPDIHLIDLSLFANYQSFRATVTKSSKHHCFNLDKILIL